MLRLRRTGDTLKLGLAVFALVVLILLCFWIVQTNVQTHERVMSEKPPTQESIDRLNMAVDEYSLRVERYADSVDKLTEATDNLAGDLTLIDDSIRKTMVAPTPSYPKHVFYPAPATSR